jgi:hypothetical protein
LFPYPYYRNINIYIYIYDNVVGSRLIGSALFKKVITRFSFRRAVPRPGLKSDAGFHGTDDPAVEAELEEHFETSN